MSVSKHNQFTFNSLLIKINSFKINSHRRQTKRTLRDHDSFNKQLVLENCFFDIQNFIITHVNYVFILSGS